MRNRSRLRNTTVLITAIVAMLLIGFYAPPHGTRMTGGDSSISLGALDLISIAEAQRPERAQSTSRTETPELNAGASNPHF
jgi:hypothetical protein